ncbi:MAG: hypothetical protein QXV69_10165 [Sulfolobaceae archaeon]
MSKLTYKEFAIDYSEELYGVLNIDFSIAVYSMGLVAYHNLNEGFNAPEYAILGYLLRKIYSIVKGKRDRVSIISLQQLTFLIS